MSPRQVQTVYVSKSAHYAQHLAAFNEAQMHGDGLRVLVDTQSVLQTILTAHVLLCCEIKGRYHSWEVS